MFTQASKLFEGYIHQPTLFLNQNLFSISTNISSLSVTKFNLQMQSLQTMSPILSLSPSSPSFNSYSSANLADIAARVVEEFRQENHDLGSDIYDWEVESLCLEEEEEEQRPQEEVNDEEEPEEEEKEFEFAFVCKKPDSPISADEIFFNGQIKPIYPLFDTALLSKQNPDHNHHQNPIINTTTTTNNNKKHRLPLRTLMNEDRETTTSSSSSSSSSSEADDLDSVEPGTYCVWTPAKESPNGCKKSNSTGSSKRWKFRDLLYRSNSDGKDTFVFLTPNNKKNIENSKGKAKVAAIEEHYVKNRAVKEDDKKRSYLPYRQDLVGFFNNVNGLNKNLHPF